MALRDVTLCVRAPKVSLTMIVRDEQENLPHGRPRSHAIRAASVMR